MKLKAKATSHGVGSFILMTEWTDESEKASKFVKEVKNGDVIEVDDRLGHVLMSKYPKNLSVVSYGGGSENDGKILEQKSDKALDKAPDNKMVSGEKTK